MPDEIRIFLQDVIQEATNDPELLEWAKGRKVPVLFSDSNKTRKILDSSLEISSYVDLSSFAQ